MVALDSRAAIPRHVPKLTAGEVKRGSGQTPTPYSKICGSDRFVIGELTLSPLGLLIWDF
jgi:hypothetical protein